MVVWNALPIIGSMFAIRGGSSLAAGVAPYAAHGGTGFISQSAGHFLRSPIIQGGQFGVGYTGGAYSGYGISNTWDPLGVHKPKYKYSRSKSGLAYGYYGRRYGRFRRYWGFRRRPYYRRSYRRGYY